MRSSRGGVERLVETVGGPLGLRAQLARYSQRLGFGALQLAYVTCSSGSVAVANRVGEVTEHRLEDAQLARPERSGVVGFVLSGKPVGFHARAHLPSRR